MIPCLTVEADLTAYFQGYSETKAVWKQLSKTPAGVYVPPPYHVELILIHPNKQFSAPESNDLFAKLKSMWIDSLDPKTRGQFSSWGGMKQKWSKRYAVQFNIRSLYFN